MSKQSATLKEAADKLARGIIQKILKLYFVRKKVTDAFATLLRVPPGSITQVSYGTI
jgi:hypothetical protein